MMPSLKQKISTVWTTYKTNKKVWVGLVLVIIILVVVIGKKTSQDEQGTVVTRRDVVDQVILSGRTESASAVELGFADTGRITGVFVKEGDIVSQGQVLATLDTSDLQLDNIDKITREQSALVANKYRALVSSDLEAVPNDIYSENTSPIISGLYKGPEGVYTIRVYSSGGNYGKSFEISGIEKGFAQPVTLNTLVPLGSYGLYIRFAEVPDNGLWTIEIPNKRSVNYAGYVTAYESAVATKDRVIADARKKNDAVISQINKRKIFAPFSGTVVSVDVKQGESADGKQTIKMISEKDYQIVLKTPEVSVAKLQVGQPVEVVLDAYDNVVFPAKIVSINPAETIVDGVPIYETKVMFNTPDERIRSGMTALATIRISEQKNVVAIPASDIYEEQGESYVDILVGDTVEKRLVKKGIRGSDSYVEIREGVSEGEMIVTK